jgi:peptidyl-prolyl cis-trans isomerase SurA
MAQAESDGRQAFRGGDLGWLKSNRVPSLFADSAATLERGDLAGPLRSASGFHIIKLEDYKGSGRQIVAQTHARHILIRTDELTSDLEAKERLARLRERIISGDDFATLARSHSDDRSSALKGGDLGWINPGNTLPRFAAEMDRLEPGAISEVFRTDFGWHIVQVLERRSHDATNEVQRANAYSLLRDRKSEEAIELYLRRLRDEAYVEVQLEDPYE